MPLRIVLSGLLLLTALGLGLVGYQVTRPPKTVTVAAVRRRPHLSPSTCSSLHTACLPAR